MKRCDICQGMGFTQVLNRYETIVGFTKDHIRDSHQIKVEVIKEKCPKCDGKGMTQ